jgi:hypothetical protein
MAGRGELTTCKSIFSNMSITKQTKTTSAQLRIRGRLTSTDSHDIFSFIRFHSGSGSGIVTSIDPRYLGISVY